MMVTFTYRNDTVDDMDIGDEDGDGDGSQFELRIPQVPRLRMLISNRRSGRSRTMPLSIWGKLHRGAGRGLWTRDVEVEGRIQ
jgi:hypothetical protein